MSSPSRVLQNHPPCPVPHRTNLLPFREAPGVTNRHSQERKPRYNEVRSPPGYIAAGLLEHKERDAQAYASMLFSRHSICW